MLTYIGSESFAPSGQANHCLQMSRARLNNVIDIPVLAADELKNDGVIEYLVVGDA